MAKDLAKWANEKGVKYFMVSFTDLAGAQRAKLVPASVINGVVAGGAVAGRAAVGRPPAETR